jgi:PKD repeat protein
VQTFVFVLIIDKNSKNQSMTGKRLFTFVLAFLFTGSVLHVTGQTKEEIISSIFKERAEAYFKFEFPGKKEINHLSHLISIDNFDESTVWAYANRTEFTKFIEEGYEYSILTPPSMVNKVVMKDIVDLKGVNDWDFYPTYDAYVNMMYQFQTDYPGLCEVSSIGQTVEGRQLLIARISDNVGQEEGEPCFLYTGTIHGDEVTGYVLLLRLIDYLLTNYGTDPEVSNLVQNLDIRINPASNPDGTYHGGNNTVYGATRYNANGVDLNRNYPDPQDGPHPDGFEWQVETLAFMAFAENNRISVSCNTHGGAEVCNYPWDTWAPLHADDAWWQYVCHEYADTVHEYAPNGYMTGFDNGITNGYAWYEIAGGRQDYMTYFHQGREFTLELTDNKMPPANQLPNFWEYNYRSLLNYMEQAMFGISGTVTDANTGVPLITEIYIENHEADSSWVYSGQSTGKYIRHVYAGTYDVTFTAPGYYPQTIEDVVVVNRQLTTLDVQLVSGELIADFTASATSIPVGTPVSFTDLTYGNPVSWQWTFEGATPSTSTLQNPVNIVYPDEGSFDVTLTVSDGSNSQTITKEDYITVSTEFLMQNITITTCSGMFYDSGGAGSDYGDNEDFTLIFIPGISNGKIKCQFLVFNVEEEPDCDYDWLKIYDGSSTGATLLGTFCGTNSPGTITATNNEGALTFLFHSDYSVTESGWRANISCVETVLPPVADFTADSTSIIEGESVHFTDLSANNPNTWEWNFEGGSPSVSGEVNPVITYNLEGVYDVMLTVTNEAGTNTEIKHDYITVDHLTGIQDLISTDIKLYPNPASSVVHIQSGFGLTGISIVNILGTTVIEKKTGSNLNILDISGLLEGFYFIKVRNAESTTTKRLQVVR